MKVIHIVDHFSSLTETFIYDYINELERHDVDNHVLTFNRVNKIERPFEKVYLTKNSIMISFILKVISKLSNKPDLVWLLKRRKIKK